MTDVLRHRVFLRVLKRTFPFAMICFSLAACLQPAPVVVTVVPITVEPRVVTVQVPVEVTRQATQQVVVTREVEVTRQVVVTQEVRVTQLVPVVVTLLPASAPVAYSGQWSSAGPMTTPRGGHTATVLRDGRVLIVGGDAALDTHTAKAEIFDPVTNTFSPTGSLNTPRTGHSATLLPDGRVLVIAGYNNTGWLGDAEIYDPATGQWTVTQPNFAHGVVHVAILLRDGRVFVMAGAKQSGPSGPDDRVEIFDPQSNLWQVAARHENTGGGASATLLADGRVLIAGGTADPAIYDPTHDTWHFAGTLITPRSQAQMARLSDGRVLLIGGVPFSASGGPVLSSAEIFDSRNTIWLQAAPLARARYNNAAVLLPDGRIMVVGGWEAYNGYEAALLNTAEVYDARTGNWSTLAPLNSGRASHTASLLPDGRVLVAGGETSRGTFLDGVEVLAP